MAKPACGGLPREGDAVSDAVVQRLLAFVVLAFSTGLCSAARPPPVASPPYASSVAARGCLEPDDAEVHYLVYNLEECKTFFSAVQSPAIGMSFTVNHAHLEIGRAHV